MTYRNEESAPATGERELFVFFGTLFATEDDVFLPPFHSFSYIQFPISFPSPFHLFPRYNVSTTISGHVFSLVKTSQKESHIIYISVTDLKNNWDAVISVPE